MTQLLEINENDRILEIGTGSGYQAAILYKTGAKIYSIERIEELYERAKNIFNKLQYEIELKLDDGNQGWIEYAPFDKIIITAAVKEMPVQLMKQLSVNGKIVFPYGDRDSQNMNVITKSEDGKYHQKQLDKFRFVPMIGKYGWEK